MTVVAEPSTADSARLLRAVAAYGLPGAPLALADEPLASEPWRTCLADASRERLMGLLWASICGGAMPVTDDQRREAAASQMRQSQLSLALEMLIRQVTDRFVADGLDYRVLKGPAVANLDYADPSERSFGDIDLLVPADQFERALALLIADGGSRTSPEIHGGFDRRFAKGATVRTVDGFEVDLHRTLTRGPFAAGVRLEDCWAAAAVPFSVAGASLRALPAEQRFLSLCCHASLGGLPPRLWSLRDVAQLLFGGALDLDCVRALAAAWRLEAVVARAVTLAGDTLPFAGPAPLEDWARAYRPTTRERRTLSLYTDPTKSHFARAMATLRLTHGVRDRAAYVRAVLFPSADYLSARHRGRFRHWQMAARPWRKRYAVRKDDDR